MLGIEYGKRLYDLAIVLTDKGTSDTKQKLL